MEIGIGIRDIGAFMPEIILFVTGLLIMLIDLLMRQKDTLGYIAIAGTLLAIFSTYRLTALPEPIGSFGGMFLVDGYSSLFNVIFYINLILTIFISLRYMKTEGASYGEYYALLVFATTGMMLMASAGDLIILYLGLELMALSTYILAGLLRRQLRSNEAALKYFFLGAFSSAFLLFGIALTYGITGATGLSDIADAIRTLGIGDNPVLYLALAFIIVAFGFKIAIVPFHMWAPDVYEGAPTSVTAFMSVGPKAAGFAVLGRVLFYGFQDVPINWHDVLIPLSILTMAVGSIIALSQRNIKRMLAYSSIAHAGYMLLGIIARSPEGITATVTYLIIYAFMNIGAFAIVIALRREGFQGEDLEDYMGLARNYPLASALMLIFMFSLTGIPPTGGFIAKFYVFMSAINAGYVYLAIIAVIFSVISAFFYLRVVMYMYMREPVKEVTMHSPASMRLALAITSLMILLLGIFPSLLLNIVRASIL